MSVSPKFPTLAAPVAKRLPVTSVHHGIERTDQYAWLRAENWQEMFKDPSKLNPSIRVHLEAENAYQTRMMVDTEVLRRDLVTEMKGRIKEDDSSIPMKDGPFAYGT